MTAIVTALPVRPPTRYTSDWWVPGQEAREVIDALMQRYESKVALAAAMVERHGGSMPAILRLLERIKGYDWVRAEFYDRLWVML